MMHKMKNCIERIGKKAIAVILLEIVVLCVMLGYAMIRPAQVLNIGCENFYTAGIGDAVYDGTSLVLQDAPAQSLGVWGYRLKGGAYKVEVEYRSKLEGSKDIQDAVAAVDIQSKWPIKYSSIQLKDTNTVAEGRLWIPMGADCRDLNVLIWYRGNGMMELKSLSITEECVYRYVVVAWMVLLFVSVDLIYVFFFSPKTALTSGKKTFLALTGITFAASLPYLASFLFAGHDLFFHLERIVLLAEELKNGQFPVRMFTTANNYYSYPVPVYYCDIFLYLPALLYQCMIPLQTCYQIYVILMNAVTCAIAYYCFFRVTKERMLSVLGAALYTLCTARLVHFTVRAALGEYTSMTFLPLVLLGIYEIYSKDKHGMKDWVPLSLGMTGIIFSHMITTELIIMDLVLFCLMMLPKTLKLSRLTAIAKAAVLCILLSAWFVVPFLDYYLTQDTVINNRVYLLQDSGTYLIQLLGVFMTGMGGTNRDGMREAMPLTIGFSLTLGMVIVLICMVNREKWKTQEEKGSSVRNTFFLIAVLNILFTLRWFPWDIIQLRLGIQEGELGQVIGSMQFSWRWLTLISALLVFCVVNALMIVRVRDFRMYRYFCAALLIAVTVSTGYLYHQYSNQAIPYRPYSQPVDKYMDELYILKGTDWTTDLWSEVRVSQGGAQILNYHKEKGNAYLAVENSTDAPSLVTIPVFAYGHYHAFDGSENELPISAGESNRIALEIAPGYSGEIQVRFVPPMYWRAAEIVSLATFLALLWTGARWLSKRRKEPAKTKESADRSSAEASGYYRT